MLKSVPTNKPNATPDWKRLSNIKHLSTLGVQFNQQDTPKDVDREGCYAALMDVIAREANALETSLDKPLK